MVGGSSGGRLRQLGTLFACGAIGGQTDAELLEHFASGNAAEAAFEALVMRHGPDVLRACRRVLPDTNDAEDAFQVTFLVLARRASSGSIGRPELLGPWLHGVAVRVARKARVTAARRLRHEMRVAARPEANPTFRDDLAGALRDEIDRLPETLRAPVVLCYLEDLTYQAAARRLDVSVGTIRGRLVKARSLLRSRLGRVEEFAATGQADGQASRGRPPRVPPALAAATIRSAMALAPGGAGMLGLSAAVAELMEGVLTMTLVTRWIIGAVTLAALGLAAAGGAALAARGDDKPPTRSAAGSNAPFPNETGQPAMSPVDAQPDNILTLDAAIEHLLRRSMDLRAAGLDIPMARADYLTSALRAAPTSYADIRLTPNDQASHADVRLIPSDQAASAHPGGPRQFDINISHPVDYTFKRRARSHAAVVTKSVVEAQYQEAVRNRIDGLYLAYVDVQEAQQRVLSSAADLTRWDQLLKEARSRANRGIVSDADISQFESAQQTAGLRLSEEKLALARTRRTLGSLLGFSVEESDRLDVERLHVAQQSIPAREVLIHLALDTRPDLAACRIGMALAGTALEEASRRSNQRADVYQLYEPYTFQDSSPDGLKSATSWALGVTVPLPIYSRNQGKIQRAKLNLEQTRIQLAAREEAIRQEVASRCKEYVSIHAGFRGILIALQHNKRACQESERRYETGEAAAEDVVKVRRDFEKANQEYIEFLARHRRSILALNTAVGVRLSP